MFPGAEEGEESAWYTLFAHALNRVATVFVRVTYVYW